MSERENVVPEQPRIVVVGGLNLDLVVGVEQLPRPGETVVGGDLTFHSGGKGANQAVAAARLGSRTGMIGRVGDDDFGRRLMTSLETVGVQTSAVGVDPIAPTGTALIAVDAAGENCIVVAPGANARLSPADIAAAGQLFGGASICVLQLEVPMDTIAAAAQQAKLVGCRVLLSAAPARRLPPELLGLVDVLVVNETEAAVLIGREGSQADQAEHARAMLDLGVGAAVLTVGPAGLWVAQPDGCHHVPAVRVQAVDTTAAGDALVGGLASALVGGADLLEASRWAAAAAAVAVTRPGAQSSLPTLDDVERLIASGS